MKFLSYATLLPLAVVSSSQSVRFHVARANFGKCSIIEDEPFKYGHTTGRGAYFNTEGTPADFTCRQVSTRQNASCEDFVQPIADAIGSILLSFAGNKSVCNEPLVSEQRKRDDPEGLQSKVSRMLERQIFENVTLGAIGARDLGKLHPAIEIKGLKYGGVETDVAIHRPTTAGIGFAYVRSKTMARRDEYGASHQGGSDTAGFKITYYGYPENYINKQFTATSASDLGNEMARRWAKSSLENLNSSRYFGVFGQQFRPILVLQIIPQIRGFGDDPEDPEEPCGDLRKFACDDPSDSACNALLQKRTPADQCSRSMLQGTDSGANASSHTVPSDASAETDPSGDQSVSTTNDSMAILSFDHTSENLADNSATASSAGGIEGRPTIESSGRVTQSSQSGSTSSGTSAAEEVSATRTSFEGPATLSSQSKSGSSVESSQAATSDAAGAASQASRPESTSLVAEDCSASSCSKHQSHTTSAPARVSSSARGKSDNGSGVGESVAGVRIVTEQGTEVQT
ncbi:hypothetical protein CBER1_10982 [Cercospora berteroae]|uniref:Uncharacterized protein n=1 Tax=Cercospora berteroae TaxID=357750 RepID=A0A2S6BXE0_9PEZI|nr:hypothetical protein CBER1_10982 [Cercospora berteroae]